MIKLASAVTARICIALSLSFCFSAAYAHEFWLEQNPKSNPESNEDHKIKNPINLTGFQGEGLAGVPVELLKSPDARWWLGNSDNPLQPATTEVRYWSEGHVSIDANTQNWPVTIAYQSAPAINHYKNFEEFNEFASAEGLGWAVDSHIEQELPKQNFFEIFYRHAKITQCISGSSKANTSAAYFPDWIVVDTINSDSTATPLQTITLQLVSEDGPVPNQPVHLFRRDSGDTHTLEKTTTDASGELKIVSEPRDQWLVSTTQLQRPPASVMLSTGTIWQSDWIAFRFNGSAGC